MKKSLCVTFLAIATGVLAGCGAQTDPNKPEDNGYARVSDDYIRQMPNEPITAVMSGYNARVSIQVESPAACLTLTKQMLQTQFAAGYSADGKANCVSRDGTVRVAIKDGIPFVLGKIATP